MNADNFRVMYPDGSEVETTRPFQFGHVLPKLDIVDDLLNQIRPKQVGLPESDDTVAAMIDDIITLAAPVPGILSIKHASVPGVLYLVVRVLAGQYTPVTVPIVRGPRAPRFCGAIMSEQELPTNLSGTRMFKLRLQIINWDLWVAPIRSGDALVQTWE